MKVRILVSATIYFLIVFTVGFLLGPIRVLLLEPRFGRFLAVLCEAPLLLTAIVIAARALPGLTRAIPGHPREWWAIGIAALLMQQVADLIVGQVVRGSSVSEQINHFATPEGAIYAALLVAFAVMPALLNHRRA